MLEFKTALASSDANVKKYIYEDSTSLVESVIYKYPDYKTRTTICISVQSGCRVGCTFCGTGKRFLRNLSADEIVMQVTNTFFMEQVPVEEVAKLQIMFMSMGEPSHNWEELDKALYLLHDLYPTAELLVSTIGTANQEFQHGILRASREIPTIGLQFSIHHFDDAKRTEIIPFRKKMTLAEIAAFGTKWHEQTGRFPFCNYVVTEENNTGYEALFDLFDPAIFNFTFSVLCSPEETIKSAFINNKDNVKKVHDDFLSRGYNVRLFDPAGQDDIGGGCGQLWYFQNKIKERIAAKEAVLTTN